MKRTPRRGKRKAWSLPMWWAGCVLLVPDAVAVIHEVLTSSEVGVWLGSIVAVVIVVFMSLVLSSRGERGLPKSSGPRRPEALLLMGLSGALFLVNPAWTLAAAGRGGDGEGKPVTSLGVRLSDRLPIATYADDMNVDKAPVRVELVYVDAKGGRYRSTFVYNPRTGELIGVEAIGPRGTGLAREGSEDVAAAGFSVVAGDFKGATTIDWRTSDIFREGSEQTDMRYYLLAPDVPGGSGGKLVVIATVSVNFGRPVMTVGVGSWRARH